MAARITGAGGDAEAERFETLRGTCEGCPQVSTMMVYLRTREARAVLVAHSGKLVFRYFFLDQRS